MKKTTNHVIRKVTASCLAFSLCFGIGMPSKAGVLQDMASRIARETEIVVNQENLQNC